MIEMIIVIEIELQEKENIMKKLMDYFDYMGYTYLYLKNTNEVLLVNKYGFATFSFNDSYYKNPKTGVEYGEMVVTLNSTEKQLPLLAQEVIKDLSFSELYKKVIAFHINREIE